MRQYRRCRRWGRVMQLLVALTAQKWLVLLHAACLPIGEVFGARPMWVGGGACRLRRSLGAAEVTGTDPRRRR